MKSHRNKRCGDVSLNRKKSAEAIVPSFSGRAERQQDVRHLKVPYCVDSRIPRRRAALERIEWNSKVSWECGAMRRWVMKNIGAGST